jgi:Na+-driven multidrug efflux pump
VFRLVATSGALSLATHGTILVCMIVTYRIPMGIAIAVNVMVGNLLGAGDHTSAKRVAIFSLLFQLCLSLCYGGATILFRHQIPKVLWW